VQDLDCNSNTDTGTERQTEGSWLLPTDRTRRQNSLGTLVTIEPRAPFRFPFGHFRNAVRTSAATITGWHAQPTKPVQNSVCPRYKNKRRPCQLPPRLHLLGPLLVSQLTSRFSPPPSSAARRRRWTLLPSFPFWSALGVVALSFYSCAIQKFVRKCFVYLAL
jgi:hypothetical protein